MWLLGEIVAYGNEGKEENMLKKETMYCRMQDCNGKATPTNQIGKDKIIHFDCEQGHKFHTDILKEQVKPCNCKGSGSVCRFIKLCV